MRQAGRYMGSYRKLRERYSFIQLCKIPELAAKVTMQPVEEIGVDAAIIFSDILFLLEGMGLRVVFGEDDSAPYIENPINSVDDVNKLRIPEMSEEFGFLLNAIGMVKEQLPDDKPLIGFSGSPWTLAAIAIQGSFRDEFRKARVFMYNHQDDFIKLLSRITEAVKLYIDAQISAGVDLIQIFDSLAIYLTRDNYLRFSLTSMGEIINFIKIKYKGLVPQIIYSRGASHSLREIQQIGCDVISIDSTLSIREANMLTDNKVALQGNLEPLILLASKNVIAEEAKKIMIDAAELDGFIFNLGHGVLPGTPEENVKYLVDYVHEKSKLIKM
jgi:uroporphyrinogen decarboxylase